MHGLSSLMVILEVVMWSIRFPRVGLLEERPAVSGRREKTQRGELQCQVQDDTAEGLVVKTVTNKIFTSLGQCDDRLTSRSVYVSRN